MSNGGPGMYRMRSNSVYSHQDMQRGGSHGGGGFCGAGKPGSPPPVFSHCCEVRSSFYTNNPLLYISHYSEIIVSSSGYDVSGGMPSLPPSSLSARRELVEQLDSEPVFEYLIQNGALDQRRVDEIRAEKSAAKVNIALLKDLEGAGHSAVGLFVNALRQTGQHHIANLLDDSTRIKQLSGSGYLSKKRHRGQVSLQIEVKAMRLLRDTISKMAAVSDSAGQMSPGGHTRSHNYTFSREWISLDDILMKIQEVSESHTTSNTQIEMSDTSISKEDRLQKKSSCFCVCFSQIFQRHKQLDQNTRQQTGNNNTPHPHSKNNQPHNGYRLSPERGEPAQHITKLNTSTSVISHQTSHYRTPSTGKTRESLENLRNMADTFRQKAERLYDVLGQSDSSSYTSLLKYFEQQRGVLVLETNCDGGFVMVNICMKSDQLDQLRRDYQSGKLTRDIEACIITDDLLTSIGAKAVKLRAAVNQDDFELAEQELC